MALASPPIPFCYSDQEDASFFDRLANNSADGSLADVFAELSTGDPVPTTSSSSVSRVDDGSQLYGANDACFIADPATEATNVRLQDDGLHESQIRDSCVSTEENLSDLRTHVDIGFGAAPGGPQKADVRELQWNSFFSSEQGTDALNEFLPEVDLTAEAPEKDVMLVPNLKLETGPCDVGYHATVERDNLDYDEVNRQEHKHPVDLADATSAGNIPSNTQHEESLVESNHHHENSTAQQTWDSVYPGWFFDYASNQWKKVEGWDQNSAPKSQLAQTRPDNYCDDDVVNKEDDKHLGDLVDSTYADNLPSMKSEGQDGVVRAPGMPDSNIRYDQNLVTTNVTYENSASQQSWDSTYPGWFFDFASNQWKQVEGWVQNTTPKNQIDQTGPDKYYDHDAVSKERDKHPEDLVESTSSDNRPSNGQYDQNMAASNASYESYALQQTWDSSYPGWFFDFTSNQWKQVEGWDPNAALEKQISQSATGNFTFSNDKGSQAVSQETKGPIGPLESQNLVNGFHESQHQMSIQQNSESMYPGWYFDYITNEWKSIEVQSKLVPVEHQTTGSTDYQSKFSASFMPNLSQENKGLIGSVETQKRFNDFHERHQQMGIQQSSENMYPGWYFDNVTNEWKSIQGGGLQPDSVAVEHQIAGNTDFQSNFSSSFIANPYQSLEKKTSIDSLASPNGQVQVFSNGMDAITTVDEYASQVFEGNRINSNAIMSEKTRLHELEMPAVTSFSGSVNSGLNTNAMMQEGFQYQRNQPVFEIHSESNAPPYSQYQYQPASVTHDSSFIAYGHRYDFAAGTENSKSSSGRPSHALVTFGFGGKLITIKATSTGTCDPITFHDLNKLVRAADGLEKNDGVSYFATLNHGGLTGPLIDGGVATKEVLKWIDDRSSNCLFEEPQCTNPDALCILWKVLRIACVHYGKLRSLLNLSGTSRSQVEDGPEVALGKLVSTLKSQNHHVCYDAMQITPSEDQLQLIISEMKRNLISGKRKDALELAKQGQLWGPALILALQQGEKTYLDTIMEMAQQQFLPGCPLRTLFLTYSGNATEFFSSSIPTISNSDKQDNAGGMLADWLANLSIIAANPTKGDEQIIMHLGDSLWKVQGEVAAAHTCYLVADANFESFSETARLCLVGADHFKWQRTFANPLSIQRTEVYEYAKSLGNPQFFLQPFQPYKLLYAHMLVEAGKGAEARRYCQAIVKHLKPIGNNPQLQFCRQSALALEERLQVHFQRGYASSIATGNLVGSIFHKIISGFPAKLASEPSLNKNTKEWFSNGQKLDNKADSTSSTSLVPKKASSNINSQHAEVPTRSISEPAFNLGQLKEKTQTGSELASKGSTTESANGYFGRFLSKAVGLIKSNKREAKLGVTNKFYYNEELKRWVEEGSEQSVEDIVPPAPPTTINSMNMNLSSESMGKKSSISTAVPHLPPSMNQFSVRSRAHGVHSRYVDTFNQTTGKLSKSGDSSIVPKAGWGVAPTAQFLIPTTQSNIHKESVDFFASNSISSFTAVSSTESATIGTQVLNGENIGQGFVSSMSSPPQIGVNNFQLADTAGNSIHSYISTELQEVEL